MKKIGVASGHPTPSKPKRPHPHSEVANSSADEIVFLHEQIEEISTDLKLFRDSINSFSDKTDKNDER